MKTKKTLSKSNSQSKNVKEKKNPSAKNEKEVKQEKGVKKEEKDQVEDKSEEEEQKETKVKPSKGGKGENSEKISINAKNKPLANEDKDSSQYNYKDIKQESISNDPHENVDPDSSRDRITKNSHQRSQGSLSKNNSNFSNIPSNNNNQFRDIDNEENYSQNQYSQNQNQFTLNPKYQNPSSISMTNKSNQIRQSIDNDERYLNEKNKNNQINMETDEINPRKKQAYITEVPKNFNNKDLFTFHDLIVPGGKNAKLCFVNEPFNKNLRVGEIADHFYFYEPTSVIVLIGANTKNKIKLFAGLSRAALNCRAVIIDSGLQTGIEKFCLRKNIELIGIAPEGQIEYPKIKPDAFSNTMLTNGHTHFILLGKDDKNLKWGQEAKFKVNFAERLTMGRKGAYPYKSKVVGIILGNIPGCIDEMLMFVERKWPMILIEDSDMSQIIKDIRNGNENNNSQYGEKLNIIGRYQKIIEIDDDSENLAASVHICLTLSF